MGILGIVSTLTQARFPFADRRVADVNYLKQDEAKSKRVVTVPHRCVLPFVRHCSVLASNRDRMNVAGR